jgi:hypothetical protein
LTKKRRYKDEWCLHADDGLMRTRVAENLRTTAVMKSYHREHGPYSRKKRKTNNTPGSLVKKG